MVRVLIADDDKNLRKVLATELSDAGFDASEIESGDGALDALEKHEYDVLILDLNMPGPGGMDILKNISAHEIPTEVIILTGHATVSTAVEAMKLGAYDYVTKPFVFDELKTVIEKAFEKKNLRSENLLLKTQIEKQSAPNEIVTINRLMIEMLETVKKVAMQNFPVLIHGESGVGKELVARAIHLHSERAEKSFVPINCGAIPETMLESELFGYEKGAFTGAYAKKPGLLDIADKGTLFLDEIGELSPILQTKLLRVIDTGTFFRIGGVREIKVDVKFISATNKDIKAAVGNGSFRQDLYYRISALTIYVPPLRERQDDIPMLIEYFKNSNPSYKNKSFSNEALKILSGYPWPGNVRELQNVVHRILLLSKNDVIGANDLPSDLLSGHEAAGRQLEDVEKEHILKILREVNGKKALAAEILGIDPKTLYRKLLGYGIKQ